MKTDNLQKLRADRVWLTEDSCDLGDFRKLAEKTTVLADYPTADAVEKNILIYDSAKVITAIASPEGRRAVLTEICEAFGEGPGVVVFKRAYKDTGIIDRASAIFDEIIEEQHRTATGGGDHFAKPGANDLQSHRLPPEYPHDPACAHPAGMASPQSANSSTGVSRYLRKCWT